MTYAVVMAVFCGLLLISNVAATKTITPIDDLPVIQGIFTDGGALLGFDRARPDKLWHRLVGSKVVGEFADHLAASPAAAGQGGDRLESEGPHESRP